MYEPPSAAYATSQIVLVLDKTPPSLTLGRSWLSLNTVTDPADISGSFINRPFLESLRR